MSSPLQKSVLEAGIPDDASTMQVARDAEIFDMQPTSSKDAHGSACLTRQEEPEESNDEGRTAASLPPVDGGRQAWAYLLCATILETLVWGE